MNGKYHDGNAIRQRLESLGQTVADLEKALDLAPRTLYGKLNKQHWSAYDLQQVSQHLQTDLLARYRMVPAGKGYLWLPDGEGLLRISIEEIEPNTEP